MAKVRPCVRCGYRYCLAEDSNPLIFAILVKELSHTLHACWGMVLCVHQHSDGQCVDVAWNNKDRTVTHVNNAYLRLKDQLEAEQNGS